MIRQEKRHGRRLAPADVYWLRGAALAGVPHDLLAARFGVSQSTVTRAVNGTTYAEVPHPLLVPGSEGQPEGWAIYSYEMAVAVLESPEGSLVEELWMRPSAPKRRFRWSALLKVMDEKELLFPSPAPALLPAQKSTFAEEFSEYLHGRAPWPGTS